ncbi:lysophospholipid acyltransferase family protein [Clostridium oryzae]|uniref:Bifunctional protein Aas n=1 Tax=Clostridium oryzae TaxID=1450648 RepID=A0A1V4IK53_9CLOT|nr:lysophospholipid acyltransferase family protein [Clostridium oryzae]OPJ60125.1 bifunctional protein Aas [Clostridium oryzae]
MISPKVAKFINSMPMGIRKYISRKIVSTYLSKYAELKVSGTENIDAASKPIIFIGNHLSNADGLILSEVLGKYDVSFVAGIKLTGDPITALGMHNVKTINIKPNSADKEALTTIISNVKAGKNIFIFPEGTRSRTGSMIEGKKGVILIAKLTKATIIPVGVYGTEKLMPIDKDGNMSSENFHNAEVFVNVGKPVELLAREKGEEKHVFEERCLTHMMKSIAALLPEEYRGYYK